MLRHTLNNPDSHQLVDGEFQPTRVCCFWLLSTIIASWNLGLPYSIRAEEWINVSGKYSVEADLVGFENESVILRKKNGKTVTVPLQKLNSESRRLAATTAHWRGQQSRIKGDDAKGAEAERYYDIAIDQFSDAIVADPHLASAYVSRGQCYLFCKNEHRKAIADHTQAIKRQPFYPEAYANRADVYLDMGEHKRAISDATQAIRLNSRFSEAYYVRSLAYEASGELQKAAADLTTAKQLGHHGDGFPFRPPKIRTKRFVSNKYGFSLKFPADWEIKDSSLETIVVRAVAPKTSYDRHKTFVSVAVFPDASDLLKLSDKDLVKVVFEGNTTIKLKWQILNSGTKNVHFGKVRWIKVATTSPTVMSVTHKFYVFQRGDDVYRIGLFTTKDNDWFQLNEIILENALATLTFSHPTAPLLKAMLTKPSPQRYVNKELSFSINFPDGWEVKGPLEPGLDIVIKAVHYSESRDKFATIIIYAPFRNESLSWAENKRNIISNAKQADNLTVISVKEAKLGGEDCLWMNVKVVQIFGELAYAQRVFVPRKDILFQIYGSTINGGLAWYKANENALLNSINSFRLLR